jgi:hypothetical protein
LQNPFERWERQMKIDDFETERIAQIIQVARQGNWLAFKALSDEPFLNETAVKETFDMCSAELTEMSEVGVTPFATRLPDGGKGIHCQITDKIAPDREITLTLRSVQVGGHQSIGILVFVPRPKWTSA